MGVANSPNHVCVFFLFSKWRFHPEINNRFHLNFAHGNTWLGSELSRGFWTLCDILSIKYLLRFSWYFLSELHGTAAEILTGCDRKHLSQSSYCCNWLYSPSSSQSQHPLPTGNDCDQKIRTIWYMWAGGGDWRGIGCLNPLLKWLKCLGWGVS